MRPGEGAPGFLAFATKIKMNPRAVKNKDTIMKAR